MERTPSKNTTKTRTAALRIDQPAGRDRVKSDGLCRVEWAVLRFAPLRRPNRHAHHRPPDLQRRDLQRPQLRPQRPPPRHPCKTLPNPPRHPDPPNPHLHQHPPHQGPRHSDPKPPRTTQTATIRRPFPRRYRTYC